MLEARHDGVRRSLSLLERLVAYINAHGHDETSRSAAVDVLRYFDLAAPLHHQDEELHVFPPLLKRADPAVLAAVETLLRDHSRMTSIWSALRTPVARWAEAKPTAGINSLTRNLVAEFCALYSSHLTIEEERVFPATKAVIPMDALADMGAEMQRRRQTR